MYYFAPDTTPGGRGGTWDLENRHVRGQLVLSVMLIGKLYS